MAFIGTCSLCSKLTKLRVNSWLKYSRNISNLKKLESTSSDNKVKKRKKLTASGELENFLNSMTWSEENIVAMLPKTFLNVRRVNTEYCFTVDDEVAEQVVKEITKHIDITVEDVTIIEGNPGLGLITKHLLKAGAPKIKLFDTLANPLLPLRRLVLKYPDRLDVVPGNIFHIYKQIYMDSMDEGKRVEIMFDGIKQHSWEEAPSLKVIGVLTSHMYFKHLIRYIVSDNVLREYGRMEHYIIVNAFVYHGLLCNEKKNLSVRIYNYVMVNLLMDITLLCKLPRKAFLPWDVCKKNLKYEDNETMFLVKVVPRITLSHEIARQELSTFWLFLKAIANSRSNRIIPFLEKLLPGCGPELIKNGLILSTEVRDLSYNELLVLYKIVSAIPGYDQVKFLHSEEMATDVLHLDSISTVKEKRK